MEGERAFERFPGGESEPAARRGLADEVADHIRAKILAGALRPGDRLPTERALAGELRVNRSSVREALKKLEQLRLIRIQQGSGIRVCRLEEASFDLVREVVLRDGKLDRSWLADLLELREALLPGILRLALSRATPEELGRAVALLERAAAPELPAFEFSEALRDLQSELARLTRNQVLVMLAHSVGHFMTRPMTLFLRGAVSRERRKLLPALRRLAFAVGAGDFTTAERALRELLARHREVLLAQLTHERPLG